MKKKIFIVMIMLEIFTNGIYAQQWEKLTYEELKTDGTYGRIVTVDAIFLGYVQHEIFLEGNLQVTYECWCPVKGEWSDWILLGKQPARTLTITQTYDLLQSEYNRHPKAGIKSYMNGIEVITIMAIPNGRSSPIWWETNGESIFTFHKIYAIKP